MDDPRPRSLMKPDGTLDTENERRFEVIFRALRNPASPRPTDPASALTFLQELHDRLNGR